MRHFLQIAFILLFSLPVFSQTAHFADSLELSLGLVKDPVSEVETLEKLVNYYKHIQPDKALEYSLRALNISNEHDLEEERLIIMINLTGIYFTYSDFKNALLYIYQAKDLADKLGSEKQLARSLHLLGIIYTELGDYDKSSDFLFESLKVNENIHNNEGIIKSLSSIGTLYFAEEKYDKALEYYFKSLNTAKGLKDSMGITLGLSNIAAAYANQNEYEKAKQYITEAISINSKLGTKSWLGANYMNLAIINQNLGNHDSVLVLFEQALSVLQEINNTRIIAQCHSNMAEFFLEINELKQSMTYAYKAFDEGRKNNLLKIVFESSRILHQIYLLQEVTDSTYKYAMLQFNTKDSLDIKENLAKQSKLELQYEFERSQQEKRIVQQRKDFINIIIIISLGLLIILIISMLTRQRIKVKNTLLEKKNLEIELNSKNKEFTTNVLYLMKKNELLSVISEKLLQIEKEAVKDETKAALNQIGLELKKNKENDIWEDFELRFKQVHTHFYENLTRKFPDLTSNDLRLCAFLKLNMSSKEISEITGQRVATLEMARSRIRKKLGISGTDTKLVNFLSQI